MMITLNRLAADWTSWLLHAGLQATILAAIVFAILTVFRRRLTSHTRYALLLLILIKFTLPPFLNFPTGLFSQSSPVVVTNDMEVSIVFPQEAVGATAPSAPATMEASAPVVAGRGTTEAGKPTTPSPVPAKSNSASVDPRVWLFVLHILGMLIALSSLRRQWRRVRSLVINATTPSPELLTEFNNVVAASGSRCTPTLLISDNTDSPFATGIVHPVVVLPRTVVDRLDHRQIRIILSHEVAHIQRRDLVVGWCEAVLKVIWWFHPVMWWLVREIRSTREECCDDELVSRHLAGPGQYCETLIEAASCQTTLVPEPLALGFIQKEHPVTRRIRRLMDATVRPSSGLRRSAIVCLLIAAACLLPGMQPEQAPVQETQLRSLFGGWRNLPFDLTADEEEMVTACKRIAQSFFSTRNNQKLFDDITVRDELTDLLKTHPDHFYAQHLLGTWHQRNGDPETARTLLKSAFTNAPVVLVRTYRHGDGTPIQGASIRDLRLECNRVQNGRLDPSLSLLYVGLVTNPKGEVQLPVFDTVFRLSGAYPDGYSAETENLGWFESKSRIGILPDVTAWRPYSRPTGFTRTADDSPRLRSARGTKGPSIVSGSNTWTLGSVARAEADGEFTIQDGRGTTVRAPTAKLPDVRNGNYMDHAIIDLTDPAPALFEVAEVDVLESKTRIPLTTFQSGAGIVIPQKQRFHLYSMWHTLPDSVDLLLRVHNYEPDSLRAIIPAAPGTTQLGNGDSFTISHLIRGHHHGWDSRSGFIGSARELDTTSEIVFRIQGSTGGQYSFWVVLKDGRRWDTKSAGWYSSTVAGGPEHIQAALDQIDHFELLPYTEPEWIYFENIRLPPRTSPLQTEVPPLEFPVRGVPGTTTSDGFFPMNMAVRSMRGRMYSGIGGGAHGVTLIEADAEQQMPNELSTVVWSANGTARYGLQIDFNVQLPGLPPKNLGNRSSMSAYGGWGAAGTDCRNVPLEQLQAVRLFLTPLNTPQ